MLEFFKESLQGIEGYPVLPWLGYCAFHLGEYQKVCHFWAISKSASFHGVKTADHLFPQAFEDRGLLYVGCSVKGMEKVNVEVIACF